MNDFTKEELETMRNGIFSCMGSSSLWRIPENNLLVDKIQSMIENYHIVKIQRRKCPVCSSEFSLPNMNQFNEVFIHCSNGQCTYMQQFRVGVKDKS